MKKPIQKIKMGKSTILLPENLTGELKSAIPFEPKEVNSLGHIDYGLSNLPKEKPIQKIPECQHKFIGSDDMPIKPCYYCGVDLSKPKEVSDTGCKHNKVEERVIKTEPRCIDCNKLMIEPTPTKTSNDWEDLEVGDYKFKARDFFTIGEKKFINDLLSSAKEEYKREIIEVKNKFKQGQVGVIKDTSGKERLYIWYQQYEKAFDELLELLSKE